MARLPILLIDDNQVESDVLTVLLEHFDYKSVVVSTSEDALDQLNKTDFAAILIDLEMPGCDGFECVKKIKSCANAFRAAIPIIGFTNHTEAAERLVAEHNGIVAYMSKPAQAEELRHMLLRFVYDPTEPNLKTLRPISQITDWHTKRNGTH